MFVDFGMNCKLASFRALPSVARKSVVLGELHVPRRSNMRGGHGTEVKYKKNNNKKKEKSANGVAQNNRFCQLPWLKDLFHLFSPPKHMVQYR